MIQYIKLIAIAFSILLILQTNVKAQLSLVETEITNLEKRLTELKEQKRQIEEKEKAIKEFEQKIQQIKTEVQALRGESPNAVTPPAIKEVTSVNSDVPISKPSQTALRPPEPSMANNSILPSNPRQVVTKCVAPTPEMQDICNMAAQIISDGNQINLNSNKSYISAIMLTKVFPVSEEMPILVDSEKKRTDKQVGAGSATAGTTSLTVKGGAPSIIGWAVENGSATSEISGNTVTLRVNPYNLSRALFLQKNLLNIKRFTATSNSSKSTDQIKYEGNPIFDLRKLNFGFSFDTSRGTETPTLIVSKQQLSAWSVRYEFINHRNPLSPSNANARNKYFTDQALVVQQIVNSIKALFGNPNFDAPMNAWLAGLTVELSKNNVPCNTNPLVASPTFLDCREKTRVAIENALATFPTDALLKNAEVKDVLENFREQSAAYQNNRDEFIKEVNKRDIVAFEYTNNREVDAPDTSNLRFIWEKGLLGKVDFTLNADLTMFNKKPASTDVKRIRDFNFALQFDAPLNDVLTFGNTVLSGSLRYTRQPGDVTLPNGVVADGTKGDILFGQLKLTIPFGDTGIKLPLSMTFGNRNEFVKESFARGNFGLTFDLDQIFRPLSIFK